MRRRARRQRRYGEDLGTRGYEPVLNCETVLDAPETAEHLLADSERKFRGTHRRDEYVTDLVDLTELVDDVAHSPDGPDGIEVLVSYAIAGSVEASH